MQKKRTENTDKITDNNKFNLFDIWELELIRKSMIHSVKNHILQGEDFGKLKWLCAELDDELIRKRHHSSISEEK